MSVVARSVPVMLIDCDTCTMRDVACADCVVTFLGLPAPRPQAALARVELSVAEDRALAALAEGGLVPPLRMTRRTGS